MEDHKITKQDKIVYAITLAAIFFGVLDHFKGGEVRRDLETFLQ